MIVVEIMTSGLPHVYELCFGLSDGMHREEHLGPRIIMAANYCRRQLLRRFGWVVPAYHKEVSATLHPGVCKHSLQFSRRPDVHFGVHFGVQFGSEI